MNLANKITITRILLIPFFVMSLMIYKPYSGFISYLPFLIFFICVLTDALDGFIARRFNQKTKLGTILDPIADKLLLLTAFISLTFFSIFPTELKIPTWVFLIIISRDILIMLGSVIIVFMTGDLHIKPSWLGKITTFFQMLTVVLILLQIKKSFIAWNIAAIFTILSGIDYLLRGSRMLNSENHAHRNFGPNKNTNNP